jgi:hypothetical protein
LSIDILFFIHNDSFEGSLYVKVLLICLQGRKLLVIGTTSCKDVLRDFEMLNVFSTIVHVSNISNSAGLLAVLENAEIFNKEELQLIQQKTQNKRQGRARNNVGWYSQVRVSKVRVGLL